MDREKFCRLLRLGVEKGASDIHFQVGNLPLYRFNGNLVELRYKVLTPEDTEEMTRLLLEDEPRGQEMGFDELDLAYELPGVGQGVRRVFRQAVDQPLQQSGVQAVGLFPLSHAPGLEVRAAGQVQPLQELAAKRLQQVRQQVGRQAVDRSERKPANGLPSQG